MKLTHRLIYPHIVQKKMHTRQLQISDSQVHELCCYSTTTQCPTPLWARGSCPPRYRTHISCIARQVLCHWATRETKVQGQFYKIPLLLSKPRSRAEAENRDSDSESPKQGFILFRASRLTLRFHRCTLSLGELAPPSESNWLLLRVSTAHIVPSTLSFHTAPLTRRLTHSLTLSVLLMAHIH